MCLQAGGQQSSSTVKQCHSWAQANFHMTTTQHKCSCCVCGAEWLRDWDPGAIRCLQHRLCPHTCWGSCHCVPGQPFHSRRLLSRRCQWQHSGLDTCLWALLAGLFTTSSCWFDIKSYHHWHDQVIDDSIGRRYRPAMANCLGTCHKVSLAAFTTTYDAMFCGMWIKSVGVHQVAGSAWAGD